MHYKTIISKITYLRMCNRPKNELIDRPGIHLQQLTKPIDIEGYRNIYNSVGENLNWLDRIFMDDDELYNKINADSTHIYAFKINNLDAGYCELVTNTDYTEILYFGLTPPFIGKSFGKYLLLKTIEIAWRFNPQWIQLNTCDQDHPNALRTYINAGFERYKTIEEEKRVLNK